MGTCMIGQATRCGLPAVHAVAVTVVADNVWLTRDEEVRPGGVALLCEYHANTPVSEWND